MTTFIHSYRRLIRRVLGTVIIVAGMAATSPAAAQFFQSTPCASDDQCGTATEGRLCDVGARGGLRRCGCRADEDCAAPLICDTSFGAFGRCNDAPCSDSSTCAGSPFGQVCDQQSCGCTADTDCPSGRVCDSGRAFCVRPACTGDTDCAGDNFGDTCQSFQGQRFCGCDSSEDCLTGLVCDTRFSSQGIPASCSSACTDDSHCTGRRSAGPHCDLPSGLCGCGTDSDCALGERCDPGLHLCVPVPCTDDTECSSDPNGFVCNVATGACGCAGDSDCPVGQICGRGGSCTPADCQIDSDCSGHPSGARCDTATGSCGCDSDDQCSDGLVCNPQLLFCVTAPATEEPDAGPADGPPADARDVDAVTADVTLPIDASPDGLATGGDGGTPPPATSGCSLGTTGSDAAPLPWLSLAGLLVAALALSRRL